MYSIFTAMLFRAISYAQSKARTLIGKIPLCLLDKSDKRDTRDKREGVSS